jgi:hypothetical protein
MLSRDRDEREVNKSTTTPIPQATVAPFAMPGKRPLAVSSYANIDDEERVTTTKVQKFPERY